MCVLSSQGCYSAVVDYFETYIFTAGALAIVVLTIEVRTAVYKWLFLICCRREQDSKCLNAFKCFSFCFFLEFTVSDLYVCSSSPWCSPCVYSEGSSNHDDTVIARRDDCKMYLYSDRLRVSLSYDITLYARDIFLWAPQTRRKWPEDRGNDLQNQQAAPVRTWI